MVSESLLSELYRLAENVKRSIIAIAGPPGSGKSTLATSLVTSINERFADEPAVILPMDGYHLDNTLLDAMGERARKGAPHTFDVDGFSSILQRVAADSGDVVVPVFDRSLDLSRAGGRKIESQHRIVIVEGNYLLLNRPKWSGLAAFYQTVLLEVSEAELKKRLVQRWLDHDLNDADAAARAEQNDLPNARLVIEASARADRILQN